MEEEPPVSEGDRPDSSISWIAVAAMARNRVIGRAGALPWHLPGDLKFFKKLTSGGTVLMGRKTFESIGRPLPNRRNLILSRSGIDPEGVEVFSSMDDLTPQLSPGERVFVIGGAEIYRLTLDLWTEVYLTRVNREEWGDTFFPRFEDRFAKPQQIHEEPDFRVERYSK